MTSKIYNRATAIGATAVFLILSLLVAKSSTPKRSDPIAQRPSTFFTDPSGARALLLVMRRFVTVAEPWRQPLYRLGPADRASSLVVAEPKIPLGNRELAALDNWIAGGGQLILLSHSGWPLRGDARDERSRPPMSSSVQDDNSESDEAKVTYLSRYAPGLRWAKPTNFKVATASGSSIPAGEDIKLRWRRSFVELGSADSIATADHQALAVTINVGRGQIVAIADASMASNGSLRRSDNAVWLVNLIASWGNGRVLFDEYHHGFGAKQGAANLAWNFSMSPWGWCLWQMAAAGLLYIFCYRRRFGRISEPPIFQRANPLDLVDARAGIFQAAGARRLAAQLILQNLFHELSRKLGRTIDSASFHTKTERKLSTELAAEKLAELESLALKSERGDDVTENELFALARLAGNLEQGSPLTPK